MLKATVPVSELRKVVGDDSKVLDLLERNYESKLMAARRKVATGLSATARSIEPKQ